MAQTDRQTDTHTDGHGDSMTNSAQWGRVGENRKGKSRKGEYHKRKNIPVTTIKFLILNKLCIKDYSADLRRISQLSFMKRRFH